MYVYKVWPMSCQRNGLRCLRIRPWISVSSRLCSRLSVCSGHVRIQTIWAQVRPYHGEGHVRERTIFIFLYVSRAIHHQICFYFYPNGLYSPLEIIVSILRYCNKQYEKTIEKRHCSAPNRCLILNWVFREYHHCRTDRFWESDLNS